MSEPNTTQETIGLNLEDAKALGRYEAENSALKNALTEKDKDARIKKLEADGESNTKVLNELKEEHQEKLQTIASKLGLENLDDLQALEHIATQAQGFQKMQEEKQAQTLANIEKYTKELGGEKFLKEKAEFLDGLTDDKKEAYLAEKVAELPKKNAPSIESVEYEEGTGQPEKSMLESFFD